MTGAIIVLVVIVLLLALAGVITYDLAPLIGFDSRAPLPRHAGQTRPRLPRGGTDEGSAKAAPGGAVPDRSPVPGAAPLPLAVETRPLYMTGEMPSLSQETADEIWWML